jgi:HEAT repeat protein
VPSGLQVLKAFCPYKSMQRFFYSIVPLLLLTGCSSHRSASLEPLDLPPLREDAYSAKSRAGLPFHQALAKRDFTEAIAHYKKNYTAGKKHNFSLLHSLCVEILKEGLLNSSGQTQLISIFASSLIRSAHLLPFLKLAASSEAPMLQLAALNAAINLADSRRDDLIIDALRSNYPLVRLEAISYLAQRRHPHAYEHTESLMQKLPPELSPYFGYLFAQIGTQEAFKSLEKLMSCPEPIICTHALVAAGRANLISLLPRVQSALSHVHPAELEAAAFAIGAMGDETSIDRLRELSKSKTPMVALAALSARSQLGELDVTQAIEAQAMGKSLPAIGLLAKSAQSTPLLIELTKSSDKETQLAASLALLKLKNPLALESLHSILTRVDIGYVPEASLSGAFEWIRIHNLSSETFKKYPGILQSSEKLIHEVLLRANELGNQVFIPFAKRLIASGITDLIAPTIRMLARCEDKESIILLEDLSTTLGRPLVRAAANLALFKLTKETKYFEKIKAFALSELENQSLEIKPPTPTLTARGEVSFELKAEEKTSIFLESLAAVAEYENTQSIDLFLDAIEKAPLDLKCALSALLIQAMQ